MATEGRGGAAARRSGRTSRPVGTVTFLFTDIEGSTRLLERLRGRYAEVLADHRVIMRDAFEAWHGHEIDTQGDSFFVAFARASDALRCAVDAQRALAAWNWPDDLPVRVRMGIHTGEPVVSAVGYVGMDVHRAARIASTGHGGQILMSGTTHDLVADELPTDIDLQDLGTHTLKDIKTEVRLYQVMAAGLTTDFAPLVTTAPSEPEPTPGDPPYRGLEAFQESDAGLFFGREKTVDELVGRLSSSKFLAVIGASGSGKSSILRAGIVPALKAPGNRQQWRVLLLNPTAHPFEALAGALEPDASPKRLADLIDELRAEPRRLALALRPKTGATGKQDRVLIAIDQLEEVFALCRDEAERTAFLATLADACGLDDEPADSAPDADRATVVITLRADFYAHLAPYDVIRTAAAASQVFLGAMSTEELRKAIEEPARLGGWSFTPGLVDLLLRDVGDEPGALPLLSHALLETWRNRRGRTMTLRSYAESGEVSGAIARTAERVYEAEFNEPQRRIGHDVFLRLTELGDGAQDTRRRVAMAELLPAQEDRARDIRAVIGALADARLVTVGEDTVEVAHEALIREWPRLQEWLRTDRDSLLLQRRVTQAATEWELSGYDDSLLFRGARLAQARDSTEYKGVLNELEQRFVDASIAAAAREAEEREAGERRELEAAQALAVEQSRRAAEAASSAGRLRRRALLLTGALALAAVLAGVAIVLAGQSGANATLAAQRAQEAQDNAALADERAREASDNAALAQQREQEAHDSEAAAQEEARKARAQRLGADATQVLLTGREPELAALLALTGLNTGYTAEADGALQSANRRISGTAFQHEQEVAGVAISPDGQTIYSASAGRIHVWDVESGTKLGELQIPITDDGTYWQLKLSDDGLTLYASEYFGHAVLYRIDPSRPEAATEAASDCADLDLAAVWAMAGNGQVLAAYRDGEVHFLQIPECTPIGTVIPADTLNDPALSDDGTRFVASTEENSQMSVWDVATGDVVSTFPRAGEFWHPSFSSDGTQVAVGMFDGTAHLFDARSGVLLNTFAGHAAEVERAVVTPDGARVLTSSGDGTARLWDAATATELRRFVHTSSPNESVTQSAMSADLRWVYTASTDGAVRSWSASGEESAYDAGEGAAVGLSFSSDGSRIASAAGGSVRVFDTTTGDFAWDVPIGDAQLAVFAPDDASLLAVAGSGVSLLDATTGDETRLLSTAPGGALGGSFSPDGMRVLAPGSGTGSANFLYDAANGDLLQIFPVERGALSKDGSRVVGWFPGRYSVYDTSTGQALKSVSLPGADTRAVDIQFTPDGTRVISGDHDNVVRVRDPITLEPLLEMPGHGGPIRQIRVSADSRYALSAGYDGSARYWDLETGELVRFFPGHDGRSLTSVAISPDGQTVALGSSDGTVIIAPTSIDSVTTEVCGRLARELTDVDRMAYGLDSADVPCP